MDFGLFNQFNLREGADYHATLKEWLDTPVRNADPDHLKWTTGLNPSGLPPCGS